MHTIGSRHIEDSDFGGRFRYPDAIAALEAAFARVDEYSQHPRTAYPVPGGDLLLMPASGPDGAGVKVLTLNPAGKDMGLPFVQGVYVLFAPGSLSAETTLDGAPLTAVRTAAVSAVATRHLARPDARRLLVFGAGTQAASHIAAMRAVRAIEHVVIVGTGSQRTRDLRDAVLAQGLDCELGQPADVASADIICACTTSATPLFAGHAPASGAHINAVGSYQPDTRELDSALLSAAQVVVETRATALEEAGDVIMAIAEGMLSPADLTELTDVVRGDFRRRDSDTVTVFKSVGVAFEDLVVARSVLRQMAATAGSAEG